MRNIPAGTRVGLVTFGSYAQANIALTDDHESFLEVVDTIPLIRGTAIGEVMLKSLTVLPELELRRNLDAEPGSLATIILLSDGNNRSGIHPLQALEQVKQQQVTVHTVGVGTLHELEVRDAGRCLRGCLRFRRNHPEDHLP